MNVTSIKYIIQFIVVVILQVLLFNNMDYFYLVSPYIYIIFLLDLPLNIKTPSLMLIAFLLGLTVDFFSGTIGLHAFASTWIGFFRQSYLRVLFSHLEFKFQQPSVAQFETSGYLKYAVGMVSLHHIALFMMESLSFNNFGFLLLRIIINIALSLLLIMCYELCRKK
jgi:rod shape-determining protein MreD